uniref:HGD n=1 Tax=Arundo donax TaxID=35708 RepID=A0A0A9F6N8_ARUDO
MWCHAAVKTSASRKKTIGLSLHKFRKLSYVSSFKNLVMTGGSIH